MNPVTAYESNVTLDATELYALCVTYGTFPSTRRYTTLTEFLTDWNIWHLDWSPFVTASYFEGFWRGVLDPVHALYACGRRARTDPHYLVIAERILDRELFWCCKDALRGLCRGLAWSRPLSDQYLERYRVYCAIHREDADTDIFPIDCVTEAVRRGYDTTPWIHTVIHATKYVRLSRALCTGTSFREAPGTPKKKTRLIWQYADYEQYLLVKDVLFPLERAETLTLAMQNTDIRLLQCCAPTNRELHQYIVTEQHIADDVSLSIFAPYFYARGFTPQDLDNENCYCAWYCVLSGADLAAYYAPYRGQPAYFLDECFLDLAEFSKLVRAALERIPQDVALSTEQEALLQDVLRLLLGDKATVNDHESCYLMYLPGDIYYFVARFGPFGYESELRKKIAGDSVMEAWLATQHL